MDIYAQLATRIIKEQESIIGPIAMEQARKVSGIKIEPVNNNISISGDKRKAINDLIEQYRELFGQASVQICKEAVKGMITKVPHDQLPSLLQ